MQALKNWANQNPQAVYENILAAVYENILA